MAKLKLNLENDYAAMLSTLSKRADGISKQAIYEGAKVAADAISSQLRATVSEESTGDLEESMGIAEIEKDKNGDWNTKIGFNWYDRKGVPNVVKARVLESGSSTRAKKPFVRPAMNKAKNEITAAMERVINKRIEEIVKK